MSPEVINRKLSSIISYIGELKKYNTLSYEDYYPHRFTVERLIQLLVDNSADLIAHILKVKFNTFGKSYREVFKSAVINRLISAEIGDSISNFASIRNLLVHQYDDISEEAIYEDIDSLIVTFTLFVKEIKAVTI